MHQNPLCLYDFLTHMLSEYQGDGFELCEVTGHWLLAATLQRIQTLAGTDPRVFQVQASGKRQRSTRSSFTMVMPPPTAMRRTER